MAVQARHPTETAHPSRPGWRQEGAAVSPAWSAARSAPSAGVCPSPIRTRTCAELAERCPARALSCAAPVPLPGAPDRIGHGASRPPPSFDAAFTGQVVARKSLPGRRRLGLVPDAFELVGDLMPDPLTTILKRVDPVGPRPEEDELVWDDSAGRVLPSQRVRETVRPCRRPDARDWCGGRREWVMVMVRPSGPAPHPLVHHVAGPHSCRRKRRLDGQAKHRGFIVNGGRADRPGRGSRCGTRSTI